MKSWSCWPNVCLTGEIAEKLFLSEGSIKQYIHQIYSELHIEGDTRTKKKQPSELFSQKT